MAGGAVAVATMHTLRVATEISLGRRKGACSQPLQSANLAIAAVVFGVVDVGISVFLVVLLPDWAGFGALCARFADCEYILSEQFSIPL